MMKEYINVWQAKTGNLTTGATILEHKALILKMGLILLFLVAGAIRLYHIAEPGTLIDREFTSAVFARAFYFQHTDSVADWQKELALAAKNNQPILEPPITEYLVSLIYRAMDSEQLWVSHILTSIFWLIGGIFFYKLAQMVVPTKAAVIATAYYLFTPLSIIVSRSFQPDALMMMLFLISLFGIVNYYKRPSLAKLLLVAGITGLALLYRPLVLFTLFGAFISLAINHTRNWKFLFDKAFIIFVFVSLLPFGLYYGYGILFAGFLRWKVETSFRPDLYFHREYWEGWLNLAIHGVGHLFMIGGLLGLSTLYRGLSRYLLLGLWCGYIVFGLLFTMHIHTHGYYHVQLIPIVALSFSSLAVWFLNNLIQRHPKWYIWLPILAAVLLVAFLDIRTVRANVGFQVFESQEVAQEIGEITHHSKYIAFISRYYAMPLQYYGEMAGAPWPKAIEHPLYRRPGERELSIQDRLDELGFEPEYFVITDFNDYQMRHADLKEFLESQCNLLAESEYYLIYDGHCTP